MASTPEPINAAIAITNTTLYTGFVNAGATRGVFSFLNLCNTSGSSIYVDLFYENAAASVTRFILDNTLVPPRGVFQWSGLFPIATSGDKIRGVASATGIDATGEVLENI